MSQWVVTEPSFIVGTNPGAGFRLVPKGKTEGSADIVTYPNPATNEINFSNLANNSVYKAEITDLSGRLLSVQTVNSNSISTGELQNGLYILKLSQNGEAIYTTKVSILK